MKVVYAKALSVPEDCDYITEGKCYPCAMHDAEWLQIYDDKGLAKARQWGLDIEGILWQRLEYPYRDPEAVEALIAAAENARKFLAHHPLIGVTLRDLEQALARLSPADGEVKT